jgi:superfamily II DNA/RNA helicase
MRTKHHAKKLAKQLTDAGIPAVDLHGNLSQSQRDRNLATFAAGDALVMVATDVAARGIDIEHVELVVHVDPPAEHKAYLHRSGRTARAGSAGDVAVVVLPTQRRDTAAMLRKAEITAVPEHVTATSASVVALVGEIAAYVKPQPRAAVQPQGPGRGRSQGGYAQGGRSQGANAQRKRANRDGAAASPRHDRSGRPAVASDTARAGQSAGRGSSQRGASHPPRAGRQSAPRTFSTSTPVGGERRSGRRAQG